MKAERFFQRINWDALSRKERVGPLRPHLSGFYFDGEYVEELTMQQVKEMSLLWSPNESSQAYTSP